MNSLYISILVGTLLIVANSQENQAPSDAKPAAKKLRLICDKCHCNNDTKVLDCYDSKLLTMFTIDEWNVLASANVTFDTMNFGKNDITEVTPFPTMPATTLIFSHNKINKIADSAFKNLTRLQAIDLSHNMLSSSTLTTKAFEGVYSPTSYEPLTTVRSLDLGYNEFHSLPDNLFEHLPNIERLTLTGNTFKVIDDVTKVAIGGLVHLKYLDMTYMELISIPDYLLHTPKNLEVLNLTGNLLKTIPGALTYAQNLQELVLDENPLQSIEGANVFPDMNALSVLSISYSPSIVKVGKGAFSGLQNLKILQMTNNLKLQEIHPYAFCKNHGLDDVTEDYPPLEKLYLHNNNLSFLGSHMLARWDKLEVVDIRSNPWDCDCTNKFMIEELFPQILEKNAVLSRDVACSWPQGMKGRKFSDVNEKGEKLRCADRYGNRPEQDGAILIGVLIGILVALPLAFALVLIYRKGCFGLFGHHAPGDYNRAFYKRAELREDFTI